MGEAVQGVLVGVIGLGALLHLGRRVWLAWQAAGRRSRGPAEPGSAACGGCAGCSGGGCPSGRR